MRSIYTLATITLLSACASGGGGGGGGETSSPSSPSSEPNLTSDKTDELASETVSIGVADSGFRLSHESLDGKVDKAVNLADPSNPDLSQDAGHGTAVASVAGNTWVDGRLLLAKVGNDDGTASSNLLDYSVGYLADEGARIINHSYTDRMRAPHPGGSYEGVNSLDSLRKITTSNSGLGSLYVIAAGNAGVAIDTERPIHEHDDIFSYMLIVGGADGDGLDRHSNYPGEVREWQERFLVAPMVTEIALDTGDTDYGIGAGTSFTAPQVAAAAADVMGLWPHMTADEVADLLLDTANQDVALYAKNDCGSGGDINCGTFYLGQGHLDRDEAMAPAGELSLPASNSVDGPTMSLAEASASLSASYGDAHSRTAALNDVAAFDELGRDYRVDLSGRIGERQDHGRRQASRMVGLQQQSAPEAQRLDMGNGWSMDVSRQAWGGDVASSFTFGSDRYSLGFYQRDGRAAQASMLSLNQGAMPMLSFQEAGGTQETLNRLSGIESSLGLNERTQVTLGHWRGDEGDASVRGNDYSATQSSVGMTFQAMERLSLSAEMGLTQEDGGLLGAQGHGALSLGDQGRTVASRVGLDWALPASLNAFASYEQGASRASDHGGLIQSVDGVRTTELAAGLLWEAGIHGLALTYRQPQRVSQGQAELSIPVGRTLDGGVIHESRNMDLSPSGRQQDIEIGYSLAATERSRLQFNTLYSIEPGHDRSASDEWAVMVQYDARF